MEIGSVVSHKFYPSKQATVVGTGLKNWNGKEFKKPEEGVVVQLSSCAYEWWHKDLIK